MKEKTNCVVCGEKEAVFCNTCYSKSSENRRKAYQKRVWHKAGNKCERCGFDDKRCLAVHHEEGKKGKSKYDIEKAKLLCLNCHMGIVHRQLRND